MKLTLEILCAWVALTMIVTVWYVLFQWRVSAHQCAACGKRFHRGQTTTTDEMLAEAVRTGFYDAVLDGEEEAICDDCWTESTTLMAGASRRGGANE